MRDYFYDDDKFCISIICNKDVKIILQIQTFRKLCPYFFVGGKNLNVYVNKSKIRSLMHETKILQQKLFMMCVTQNHCRLMTRQPLSEINLLNYKFVHFEDEVK